MSARKVVTEIHLDIEPVHEIFELPIYNLQVGLIITEDVVKSRKNLNHMLGKYKGGVYPNAMCSSNAAVFRLFFQPPLRHSTISHEVFHLTHAIMDTIGASFCRKSEESYAYLHGQLCESVYGILRKHKMRAK